MTAESLRQKPQWRYTVGISKGGAGIEVSQTLLQQWTPAESYDEFLARVLREDYLGKHTAKRTADLVDWVFRRRLLNHGDQPARWLKLWLERNGDRQTLRDLLFLYAARADDLLQAFVLQRFWPAVKNGELLLRPDDAINFFAEGVEQGYLPKPWSAPVQKRMAVSLLAVLRDFGLLHEHGPGRREIAMYRVSDAALAFVTYELHLAGYSDAAIRDHPDWLLFGLDVSRWQERLDHLPQTAGILIQRAGSIIRLSWVYQTMEEFIYANTA